MASYTEKFTQSALEVAISQTLGLKLLSQNTTPSSTSPPKAILTFTTKHIHLTPRGTVHGGISILVLDTACFLALIPTLSDGQLASTIASSLQLVGSTVGEGKMYEAEGRVVRRGGRIAFCEGEVRCEGKIIAKGIVTKMITSPDEKKQSKL